MFDEQIVLLVWLVEKSDYNQTHAANYLQKNKMRKLTLKFWWFFRTFLGKSLKSDEICLRRRSNSSSLD